MIGKGWRVVTVSCAATPRAGTPVQVKDAHDANYVIDDSEEESVGERLEDDPTHVLGDHWKLGGPLDSDIDRFDNG
jgi:hypothetical protein